MIEAVMRPAVADWLERNGYYVAYECMISGYCDVIGSMWEEQVGRRKPDLLEMICVELKMRDIRGVISQARCNHYHANLSYCAMPADFCGRMKPDRIQKFIDAGVGLLAVDGDDVKILVYSLYHNKTPYHVFSRRQWNYKLNNERYLKSKSNIEPKTWSTL